MQTQRHSGDPVPRWLLWTAPFVLTFVLLKVVNALMGARADEHEERVGLDLTGHRESAYTVLD
jgi:ammonia channel protein AmtB